MADLDWQTFSASKRHKLKEYDDLSCFNLHLFLNSALFSRKSVKTVPFECTIEHTHSFTNGVKCRHTTLVLSRLVSLSATSSETHSVVKLSLLQ